MKSRYYLWLSFSLCSACKFVPYSGNDVYNKQATLDRDEAVHYKNSLEWWYYTGHLRDEKTGKNYGLEYVFFHFNPRNKKDYMMVNFALTDEGNKAFYYDYHITPLKTVLEPELPFKFELNKGKGSYSLEGMKGNYTLSGKMRKHDVAIALNTSTTSAPVFHDSSGYEVYGKYAKAGYYSYPDLDARGQIMLNEDTLHVSGKLWYDRQWNCIDVWQRELAWDWVSVQFEGPSSELMIYKLYNTVQKDTIYGGSYIKSDGEIIHIEPEEIFLREKNYWVSNKSKIRYPIKWQLNIPKLDLSVDIEAVVPDQELTLKFTPIHKLRYWEGMCRVEGEMAGKPIKGNSYIEMTNRHLFQ
ncbi:hypothetical protein FNH22_22930 [Fulvivirga sp. M361]|uniref:lipocalin family protein n=1 Tax=Fulvivirga sp. M361 TaxID=2594266 RepID=UPI00117AC62A|nr:lipocalin family protein [Fulvivirga sp. M361]TRX52030.1 hypothetical protein FNH22_22930 [Fulvivirga sp. M361]